MTHNKLDINNSSILVYGIGTKGMEYPTRANKKLLKEYDVWSGMLERCTEKLWVKFPTYIGTTCSDNFKSYSYFYEWCNNQVGFSNNDEVGRCWHLDKDLLFKGNKHYAEDTCVFIPQRINKLLTKRNAARGGSPIGVSWRKNINKFVANCNNSGGKYAYLGSFKTQEEAFQAYKNYKELLIKEIAEDYREKLDCRAYQALINYEVNIND